ncbi:ABC transporter substrate-binding protein [Phytohabitans suffuscus]|uniref:ABC transporter substrate-binding protein n=1 Tax=Phytohabitans suffuscus TaxID=624315 RepID=UPI001E3A0050|nr:ABC transporter substrate-binding protein [Phytohabitans suffuscus]
MRLVSLLPSATEIVYALGLGEDLVGVTFECDEPPAARRDKAVVVGGRDTRDMTPGQIDAYVKTQLAAGADLYTLHADALAGLDPELILTQDLCRVCALPSGHVDAALDYLGCRADVLSLDPYTLDQVLDTIHAVGARAGVPDRADTLVTALRARLDAVAAAVAGRPRPRVLVVEWVDPPFAAGHWVPDLVEAAGVSRSAQDPAPARRRPPGTRCLPSHRTSCWSPRAAFTLTAPPPRPARSHRGFPARRYGRSTPTASSSAPVPASSTASRRSPRSCTPTPYRRHRLV